MSNTGAVSQSGQPQPYQSFGTPFGVPPEPEPGLPWAKAIAVTIAVFLVAGSIAGWAWQRFSPLAQYTVDERGGSLGEEQMTKIFGPDGTFTAIGFLTALVLGAALFWWLRNYGPWAVGIVALGSVLGGGVAWVSACCSGTIRCSRGSRRPSPATCWTRRWSCTPGRRWRPGWSGSAGGRDSRRRELAQRTSCNRIVACRVRGIAAGALTCPGPVVRPPAT